MANVEGKLLDKVIYKIQDAALLGHILARKNILSFFKLISRFLKPDKICACVCICSVHCGKYAGKREGKN